MRWLLPCVALLLFLGPGPAQDGKKKEEKKGPRVLVALPLGVPAGQETRVVLRGAGLENATEVRVEGDRGKARVVAKGKAPVPDKNPERVGDTQVEVLLTVDPKLVEGPVNLVVVTPEGQTPPHGVLVETRLPVVAEKEPNDGFRQAQPVPLPAVVEGRVERPRDVDVFRVEGRAGQKLVAEVRADRHGSPLDAVLTLYGPAGQELASNDDGAGAGRDSRLEAVLPADGVYYLALIDAHDTGSAVHAYRLVVR